MPDRGRGELGRYQLYLGGVLPSVPVPHFVGVAEPGCRGQETDQFRRTIRTRARRWRSSTGPRSLTGHGTGYITSRRTKRRRQTRSCAGTCTATGINRAEFQNRIGNNPPSRARAAIRIAPGRAVRQEGARVAGVAIGGMSQSRTEARGLAARERPLDGRAPDDGQSAGNVHGRRLLYQMLIGTSATDSGTAMMGGGWRLGPVVSHGRRLALAPVSPGVWEDGDRGPVGKAAACGGRPAIPTCRLPRAASRP